MITKVYFSSLESRRLPFITHNYVWQDCLVFCFEWPNTICESLIKIYFLDIMQYIELPKTQLNQITIRNLQWHLTCQHIKMFVLIRHTFCESLVSIQQATISFFKSFLFGSRKNSGNIGLSKNKPKTNNNVAYYDTQMHIWPMNKTPLTKKPRCINYILMKMTTIYLYKKCTKNA